MTTVLPIPVSGESPGAIFSYITEQSHIAFETIKDRRDLQVRYAKIYLLILASLLTVASYGLTVRASSHDNKSIPPDATTRRDFARDMSSESDKLAVGIVGIIVTSFVCFTGCGFTVFLGNNFRGVLIAKKNLFQLRKAGVAYAEHFNIPFSEPAFCDGIGYDKVGLPASYATAHYWMMGINSIVILAMLFFLKFVFGSWMQAILCECIVLALFAWFYPTVSFAYERYLLSAMYVSPTLSEEAIRKEVTDIQNQFPMQPWKRPLKSITTNFCLTCIFFQGHLCTCITPLTKI
jgi:hypothetical protein